MLRSTFLYLSQQPTIFRFVRGNGLARSLAARFVAGETIDSACDAAAAVNAKGMTATLDLLGESVTVADEVHATVREYVALLDRIAARRLDANVSVKLTALGLDLDPALCTQAIRAILDRAAHRGTFVRLDMEASGYVDRTLDLFEHTLYPAYRAHVGIVLQSMLRRTAQDVERAVRLGCRVRIVKGAYLEPPEVAFPDKADVDRAYVAAMHALLQRGHYPAIATHDEAIIAEAKRFAEREGIARDRFEFQMLYGIRRDLQEALVREGYRLRVYIPYGAQWYPYLMRRLAERPANVAFITGSLVREMVGGRR
jgi:proline dehydrogenase